ncbi:MAG: ABC transporter ATP-binding protein [Rhodocyclaceae bacterium]|nr:ABC transporter ATP-binding protein [Rhodocyclaceae bacterium]
MTSSARDTPALLEAEALALRAGERWLCSQLALRLTAGECVVVLGPNGSGKTTLLHTLAGLREPGAGVVRLQGLAYRERSPRDNARLRALLPQIQVEQFSCSVLEATLVGRHPHVGRWSWESRTDLAIAHAALTRVGIDALAGRDILSLSGGERQRVAIAALLAQQPSLYLLDEPLNHLDLRFQIQVLELFRELARDGAGVVMVVHDINLAARYADQVVLLDGRGGVLAGRAREILQPGRLADAFGHPLIRAEVDGHTVFVPR